MYIIEVVVIYIIQIILSLLLIGAILLQMQGSGLTTAFGGSGEFYRSKRSVEKVLFYGTIVLAGLFGIVSIMLLFPR
jgi:preprotein translocase subunit SecG